jgi:DNA-binding CsgD family transcriptional regulator
MAKLEQSAFVEVLVDKLILESFSSEQSAYHQSLSDLGRKADHDKVRGRVIWHINHSLSRRQKEVIKLYLIGKRESEISRILGIKQQVVNIYKRRAINKLRAIFGN